MHKLTIEWKHFDKSGKTCQRCSETGDNLREIINELQKDPLLEDTQITFKETKLPQTKMSQSNTILINNIPLENLVKNVSIGTNQCRSCSDLIEQPFSCSCRTVKQNNKTSEEIPKTVIKQAIRNVLKGEVEE